VTRAFFPALLALQDYKTDTVVSKYRVLHYCIDSVPYILVILCPLITMYLIPALKKHKDAKKLFHAIRPIRGYQN